MHAFIFYIYNLVNHIVVHLKIFINKLLMLFLSYLLFRYQRQVVPTTDHNLKIGCAILKCKTMIRLQFSIVHLYILDFSGNRALLSIKRVISLPKDIPDADMDNSCTCTSPFLLCFTTTQGLEVQCIIPLNTHEHLSPHSPVVHSLPGAHAKEGTDKKIEILTFFTLCTYVTQNHNNRKHFLLAPRGDRSKDATSWKKKTWKWRRRWYLYRIVNSIHPLLRLFSK